MKSMPLDKNKSRNMMIKMKVKKKGKKMTRGKKVKRRRRIKFIQQNR